MAAPTDEDAAMTAVATRRRTIRAIGLVGACALAVVSLSGCLKLDADLTVNADATASGTLAVEFQKEAASFLGITDMASFEEGFASDELGTGGLEQFTDCTTSETDAAYVYTCTFENESFEGTDSPWTITKEGDLVTLRVVNEAQSGDDAALLGDASLGSITVSATFPGPITAVSGDAVEKTSDTTATISGSLTDSIDSSVTSESSSGGFSVSSLLVILLALAVVALIVIVAVVLLMRRRKGPQDDAVSVAEGAPAAATAAAAGVVVAESVPATEVVEVVETTEVVETVTEAAPIDVAETTEAIAAVDVVETTEVIETVDVVEVAPTEAIEATEVTETVETVDAVETVAEAPADPETPSV
jgi:hypothetical protein